MKYLFTVITSALLLSCSESKEPAVQTPSMLTSVITSFQDKNEDFRPGEKVVYFYSPGKKLMTSMHYSYDITTGAYELFSSSTYIYSGEKLTSIEESIVQTNFKKVTQFSYDGAMVTKIKVDDQSVDSEVTIQYLPDNTIEAFYTFSNGRSFTYIMALKNSNIGNEQTINDSQEVSSKIANEFDGGKNPYSLLGFTDYLFVNLSPNNKTKTTSEYFGSFPTSVPVSYEYRYNEHNLPHEQVTTYQSYPNGTKSAKVKTVFEYK